MVKAVVNPSCIHVNSIMKARNVMKQRQHHGVIVDELRDEGGWSSRWSRSQILSVHFPIITFPAEPNDSFHRDDDAVLPSKDKFDIDTWTAGKMAPACWRWLSWSALGTNSSTSSLLALEPAFWIHSSSVRTLWKILIPLHILTTLSWSNICILDSPWRRVQHLNVAAHKLISFMSVVTGFSRRIIWMPMFVMEYGLSRVCSASTENCESWKYNGVGERSPWMEVAWGSTPLQAKMDWSGLFFIISSWSLSNALSSPSP